MQDLNTEVLTTIDLSSVNKKNIGEFIECTLFEISDGIEKAFANTNIIVALICNDFLAEFIKNAKEVNATKINIIKQQYQDTIEIVISDNGDGLNNEMFPENKNNYADFLKKTNSIKKDYDDSKKFGGLGRGLADINKVVKIYNGDLFLKKNNTGGTSIILSFPVKTDYANLTIDEIKLKYAIDSESAKKSLKGMPDLSLQLSELSPTKKFIKKSFQLSDIKGGLFAKKQLQHHTQQLQQTDNSNNDQSSSQNDSLSNISPIKQQNS